MKIKIFTHETGIEHVLSEFGDLVNVIDPFNHPQYYHFQYKFQERPFMILFFRDRENYFVQSYLMTRVSSLAGLEEFEGLWDIEGAYGYNGPSTNVQDPQLINSIMNEFSEQCVKKGIVAEFVRFNRKIPMPKI